MEPTDPSEKLEFWREHVRRAALFEGTQGKYAEQNDISASKLSYYKGLFNPKPKPSFAKVEPKIEMPAPPPKEFAKQIARSNVPDAIWVATLLRELFK
jgi:hypothetical protein